MSRSRRKHPFCSWTCNGYDHGEKIDKKLYHRRLRKAVRQAIHEGKDILPGDKELSDPWLWSKDGKQRFNLEENPRLMRK